MLEVLKDEYNDKADILYFEISWHQVLAKRWGVRSIPAIIVFDKKGKEIYRDETGINIEEHIRSALKKMGIQ